MLARSGLSVGTWLARGLTEIAKKGIEQRCDEIFETVIRPILIQEGSDVIFHGIKDDCAIISLHGNAETVRAEHDDSLPEEILEVLKAKVPEVKYIRKKFLFED
jgi:Fe-S cluster biogenesis protein NfuA